MLVVLVAHLPSIMMQIMLLRLPFICVVKWQAGKAPEQAQRKNRIQNKENQVASGFLSASQIKGLESDSYKSQIKFPYDIIYIFSCLDIPAW